MSEANGTGTACVVRPNRNIVASCLEEFRKELQDLLSGGCRDLVIDLKGVEIIDSRGLGLFMNCYNSLARVGGKLTLVTASADLQKLFHVMRLDQYVTVVSGL